MNLARWISMAMIATGLIAGTAFDARVASAPARAGRFHIVAADLHVHAFPGDGALPGWELAREASRRALHAIVISNHNQTLAARLAGPKGPPHQSDGGAALQGPRLPLLIPSQEITTPRFHLVAAGVTRTIDWRKPELEIVRDVHEQGGAVIAAHPIGRFWRSGDAMLAALDGAEVAHPLTGSLATGRDELTAFFARVRAVNPDIAPIGSSDFHMVAPMGICRTYVLAESVTVQGVLDAIRAGRTVAQDQDGVLYGAPELRHLVANRRAAFEPPRHGRRVTLAALLVLFGFLGLVIVRPSA